MFLMVPSSSNGLLRGHQLIMAQVLGALLHMGNQDEVPGCWLGIGPALAVAGTRNAIQQI